ncbi:MAG: tetratricopeptide repeat protein [candidate division KSB1 bacterium]|nr:tetratricopeptide repeat protein [candidate division KSB1 bacterium]MDZ7358004.1 tetratricopeptide repeat protein [candidate division KSB1 bacterium]
MESIGLNNEISIGGKNFHVQTHYLESGEKVISNVFENGVVVFNKGISVASNASAADIRHVVSQLHQLVISDLEMIYYIAEKVKTIHHAASNNKLGLVFLKRNLLDDAVSAFKRALEIDPELVEGYNNLGYALLRQGAYQEAIEAFNTGIMKNEKYADLHFNLGVAYFQNGKFADALRELNNAIAINSNYVAALLYICMIHLKSLVEELPDVALGSISERITFVENKLIDINSNGLYFKPENIDAALEHVRQANYSAAIDALDAASKELPELLDSYLESEFYLKFMFGGKGKDEQFINEYIGQLKAAIEKYPSYADLHNNLGIAYLIKCRNLFLNALEEFREAKRINPDFKKADKNLKLAENDGKGFLILLRAILK